MATEQRLIDADFLDDRCRRQMADEWNKKVAPVSWSEAYKEFLDDVWDAPTVDARPVVHGRWIEFNSFMTCSECDTDWYYGDNDCDRFDFCPNCGALMDGGADNGKAD